MATPENTAVWTQEQYEGDELTKNDEDHQGYNREHYTNWKE